MSTEARTKVALLGAGYIVDSHAAALKALPQVSLQYVCDSSAGRAGRAAQKFGIPNVVSSIEELVATDCDAVHVLLPPAAHLDAAFALVEAGKSVFIEKPMGLDSAACNALCALASKKGVAIGVNHNFLFSPGYEALRTSVKAGELGRLDHLSVNWHFALPILQFGPFDNWMLAAPANIMFELGPHLCAFVLDLLGATQIKGAVISNPLLLPGAQTVYRHWSATGCSKQATAQISLSITSGQPDRILRVRGRGASAQLDFGRDIWWREETRSDNPIFDAFSTADAAGRFMRSRASSERIRRLRAAIAKRPDANSFEESIFRSIQTFYAGGVLQMDPRHDGRFAADVIRMCEAVTAAAEAGPPSIASIRPAALSSPAKPRVLVVGGTGFIGRHLVRMLVERGHAVRVVTRNARAAAIELAGLQVDCFAGSHGDSESIRQALEGIEVVYHLAKCEGKRWQDYVDGDIAPTRVLAEAALAAGVRRFIYTGTISSYASDDPATVIDNTTAVDAAISSRSHYARSKAACEALLQSMHRERGLPLVIVRPGIVIGPGTPPAHLGVGRFTSETQVDFWGDGENPLPLVLVDDVADALVKALDAPGIEGQSLLLTSPPMMNAKEYVDAIAVQMGARITARPRSPWRYWLADMVKELVKNAVRHPNRRWPSLHDSRCNAQLARYDGAMTEKVLDWKPVADRQTMLRRGIVAAVDWYTR